MAEGGVGSLEEITGDVMMDGKEMTEGEVRAETLEHIKQVNAYVLDLVRKLLHSAKVHDTSKLCDPEKELFRKYTPLLKDCTFGSPEYEGYLAEMKVALDHHYADPDNSHHPEHFENGIDGMTLMDLIEMICDWNNIVEILPLGYQRAIAQLGDNQGASKLCRCQGLCRCGSERGHDAHSSSVLGSTVRRDRLDGRNR